MFEYQSQLFRCLLQSSNSTDEQKPVFIWVMSILEQDLERETWNTTKISTNHDALSLLEPDLDFVF